MPNRNYIRGRKFEYDVVERAKQNGAIMAFRTAGSHGPYDVIAFYSKDKIVHLTQCKTKLTNDSSKAGKVVESEYFEFGQGWQVTGSKATRFIRRK